MKLFSLVRASLLASVPFLYATAKSAHVIGEGICQRINFSTPCIDAPLKDYGLLLGAAGALYEATVRVVPTAHNLSLVAALARGVGAVLDKIAPNQTPSGATHRVVTIRSYLTHGLAS